MGEANRAVDTSQIATIEQPIEVLHLGSGLLTANIGPVYVAVWRDKPTPSLFDVQREQLAAATARHRGRQLFLCVVEAHVDPPEHAVRDASANMIHELGPALAGCAGVIEGRGVRSALTRTVLTGIAFVSRTVAPFRFFDDAGAACEWLEIRAVRGSLEGLAARVEQLRAQAPASSRRLR